MTLNGAQTELCEKTWRNNKVKQIKCERRNYWVKTDHFCLNAHLKNLGGKRLSFQIKYKILINRVELKFWRDRGFAIQNDT